MATATKVQMSTVQQTAKMLSSLKVTSSASQKKTQTGGGEVDLYQTKRLVTDAICATIIYEVTVSGTGSAGSSPYSVMEDIRQVRVEHTCGASAEYDFKTFVQASCAAAAMMVPTFIVPNLKRVVADPLVGENETGAFTKTYSARFTIFGVFKPGDLTVNIHTGSTGYDAPGVTNTNITTRSIQIETYDTNMPGVIGQSGGVYFLAGAERVANISEYGRGEALAAMIVVGDSDIGGGILHPSGSTQAMQIAAMPQAEIVDQVAVYKDFFSEAVGYDATSIEMVPLIDADRAVKQLSAPAPMMLTLLTVEQSTVQY